MQPPFPLSPVSKLYLFISSSCLSPVDLTDWGGGGLEEEPNHTPARKPGTLLIIQYSLVNDGWKGEAPISVYRGLVIILLFLFPWSA